jgi:hypothetical protein
MDTDSPVTTTSIDRALIRSLARDIALNAAIPLGCYFVMRRLFSSSELTALLVATIFPVFQSGYDVVRKREIDPVAVLVLLGLATGIAAVLIGGDPHLLLIRESFFTGAFGIACLASLTFQRPIMFYFARYFMAGGNPQRRKEIDDRWRYPAVRRAHRVVTLVWGIVFAGEFVARTLLVYTVPAPVVLGVSPIIFGMATILLILWTFRYARKVPSQVPE